MATTERRIIIAKFRKKPVVIEAFRLNERGLIAEDWFWDAVTRNDIITHCFGKHYPDPAWCEIKTLEGTMIANAGDYIIQGVHGEIYPCKADIFQKTYTEDKPKTNADRIRAMSDEELVVFLDGFSGRCLDCAQDAKNESCQIYKEGHYCRPQDIMGWLQQPAYGDDYAYLKPCPFCGGEAKLFHPCYEELKKVRSNYVDVMKAIRNPENGKITCCDFGVFMPNNVHNSYCDLVARLKKEVNDLKEKTLGLQASLEYYKHKCGELMNE